jgi:predicted membrane channel-forming protein YqfA (hemolysin III family)
VTARKRHTIYALVFFVTFGIFGLIFNESIASYCSTVSWVAVLSMMISLGGVFYAVLERNLIVGVVTVAAALVLPWVKTWVVAYWPWIHQCFASHHFFHH